MIIQACAERWPGWRDWHYCWMSHLHVTLRICSAGSPVTALRFPVSFIRSHLGCPKEKFTWVFRVSRQRDQWIVTIDVWFWEPFDFLDGIRKMELELESGFWQTDRQTDRHTNATENITSSANAGGNNDHNRSTVVGVQSEPCPLGKYSFNQSRPIFIFIFRISSPPPCTPNLSLKLILNIEVWPATRPLLDNASQQCIWWLIHVVKVTRWYINTDKHFPLKHFEEFTRSFRNTVVIIAIYGSEDTHCTC